MHVSTNADCFSLCSSYPHLVDIDAKQSRKWQVCHLVVSDPVAPRCKSVLGPDGVWLDTQQQYISSVCKKSHYQAITYC